MVSGVSETFSESLYVKLKVTPFSLNFDEATSKNLKKVITILASFYSVNEKKVIVVHFGSVEIIKANLFLFR